MTFEQKILYATDLFIGLSEKRYTHLVLSIKKIYSFEPYATKEDYMK